MAFDLGNNLASLSVKIGADLSGFKDLSRRIERELAPVRQRMQKIGSVGTKFATLPIVAFGAAALKAGADLERLQLALQSALGSAEAAAKEMERLREAAKSPGLGFEQAIRGSVRLQAVGFSADEARAALVQFGNAIALAGGSADDLDGVALALTQIASKGAVSAEEINQIAERVPQVRAAMQDAFGTASSEMIQKLGIDAKDFVRGLISELSELERAQGGLANTFENIQQTISSSLGRIGIAINEAFDIGGLAQKLTGTVEGIVDAFLSLDSSTRKLILTLTGIAAVIFPATLALSAMLTPVGLVVAGIAALAAAAALFVTQWDKIWLTAETIVFIRVRPIMEALQVLALGLSRVGLLTNDVAVDVAGGLANLEAAWKSRLGNLAADIDTSGVSKFQKTIDDLKEKAGDAAAAIKDLISGTPLGVDAATPNVGRLRDQIRDILTPGDIGRQFREVYGDSFGTSLLNQSAKSANEFSQSLKVTSEQLRTVTMDAQMLQAQAQLAMEGISTGALEANASLARMGEAVRNAGTLFTDRLSAAIGDTAFGVLTLEDGFRSVHDTIVSFGDMAKRVLASVAAQLVQVAAKAALIKIGQDLFGGKSQGEGGGFLGSFKGSKIGRILDGVLAFGEIFTSLFGGARAAGGPVMAGSAYLVGERGPELFVPNRSGSIAPNHAIGGVQRIEVTGRLVGQGNDLVAVIDQARFNQTRGF